MTLSGILIECLHFGQYRGHFILVLYSRYICTDSIFTSELNAFMHFSVRDEIKP